MASPVTSRHGLAALLAKGTLWRIGKTLLLVVLVFSLTKSLLRSSSGPELNQLAKPFELPVAGSDSVRSLSDFRGAPVLVEAIASWCGVCRDSAAAMREAALAKRQVPIHFLGVAVDTNRAAAAELKTSWNIPYDVLTDDGHFAAAYKISLLPTFILIDQSGVVKQVYNGRAERADIETWLAAVGAAESP